MSKKSPASLGLVEDLVRRAVADKYPGLTRLEFDGTLTLRFYGHDHLIEVHAFDITEEDKPRPEMPRPNLIE